MRIFVGVQPANPFFTVFRQTRAARRTCRRCEQIRKDASFRLMVTFD
jgi:hypothetical protein